MNWGSVLRRLRDQHRPARSFQEAMDDAGGVAAGTDRGVITVPTEQIVGSVSRWQNLRSDFFYRTGRAVTRRFERIGAAMRAGKELPPIVLYKLKRPREASGGSGGQSEYFVVDGHHRVAMARKLGQDFMDARVTEYTSRDAQLAHALRRVILLRDAPAEDLAALWRRIVEEHVSAGTTICARGAEGDRFYIVKTGLVEVCIGVGPDSIPLHRLGPGACFGELALLTGEPRSADVVAIEDTTLWTLHRSDFDAAMNRSVPLLRALNQSVALRLAMTTRMIEQARLAGPAPGVTGLRFGPYRVIAQLGSGGMSVVYSAVREHGGLAAAVKVLPASWGDAPELRARLEREGAVLQKVLHPGVIRILEIGTVDVRLGGGTYLAMEWLPDALDRTLCSRYPEPLDATSALRIAAAVADALAAVHAAGLVHRDVKPANILLRADGEPVLTDFGLAAAVADMLAERRLTPPNMLLGTADYLAPEVIAGRAVDGRADLYALGVVLFEMLAGCVPFAGRDPLQTLRAHVEDPVPDLPPNAPWGVRAVVAKALEKDPDNRFASATDMATAIRSCL